LLGKKEIPKPSEFEDFTLWADEINQKVIDVFAGRYDPKEDKISANIIYAPSFRSSPLVKKVIKALRSWSVEYNGENSNDSDFADFVDTRDKLPDVFYHGT